MTSFISHYAQEVANQLYFLAYGYVLNATSENLKWALQQTPEDVLKYKFQTKTFSYSILEFSIKSGDEVAVKKLIELNADVEFSASGSGNMLHFFMGCLKEDTPPNFNILNLLLDKVANINDTENDNDYTPLESAIAVMANYKRIHWGVIEALLQRGSKIAKRWYDDQTPFMILRDSHSQKIKYDQMMRSAEEERIFLNHLVDYLALEKKHCPDSKSSLTLKEFNFHTSNLRSIFSNAAISLDCSSFISKAVNSLAKDLEEIDLLEEDVPSEEKIAELKESLNSWQNGHCNELSRELAELGSAFMAHHTYFQALVKKGSYRECFQAWELMPILSAIEENRSPLMTILSSLLKSWGLSKEMLVREAGN